MDIEASSSKKSKKSNPNANYKDRLYFHSITGEILDPDNYEVDSENEIDDSYIHQKEDREIDDFIDICQTDKEFFKLWNGFINKNPKY
jgi:hypothetical protein